MQAQKREIYIILNEEVSLVRRDGKREKKNSTLQSTLKKKKKASPRAASREGNEHLVDARTRGDIAGSPAHVFIVTSSADVGWKKAKIKRQHITDEASRLGQGK